MRVDRRGQTKQHNAHLRQERHN